MWAGEIHKRQLQIWCVGYTTKERHNSNKVITNHVHNLTTGIYSGALKDFFGFTQSQVCYSTFLGALYNKKVIINYFNFIKDDDRDQDWVRVSVMVRLRSVLLSVLPAMLQFLSSPSKQQHMNA